MSFFTNAIDVLQTLVIALGGGLCVWAASTFWKVTAKTTPPPKLMCRKVTQENLIDISLLFRENLQNGIDRLRNAAYTKSYQNNLI